MELRSDLPRLPVKMRGLSVDHRGFPVPWFVAWIDGVPDFRVVDTPKWYRAIKQNLCWLCGQPKGRRHAFVIGPMCAVNRVASEPSCHLECAEFAVKACPFMVRPRMRRNEHELPAVREEPPGLHLDRNPGACCIWVTRSFQIFNADMGNRGNLIHLGEPEHCSWYAEGRTATREEVTASINSGMPFLRNAAAMQGPDAVAELDREFKRVEAWLPKQDVQAHSTL